MKRMSYVVLAVVACVVSAGVVIYTINPVDDVAAQRAKIPDQWYAMREKCIASHVQVTNKVLEDCTDSTDKAFNIK